MLELSEEETLMSSDDGNIQLTTRRIVQEAPRNIQIMLEDLINYELKPGHIGNYVSLTVIFAIGTVLAVITSINNPPQTFFEMLQHEWTVQVTLAPLLLSILFLLISRRYIVRINGKFNYIVFRVKSYRKASLKKFLLTLESQSEKIKREKKGSP